MNVFTIILIFLSLYALCAMSMIWCRRRKIRKVLDTAAVSSVSAGEMKTSEPEENLIVPARSAYDISAAEGKTFAQMSSFVMSVILLGGGLVSLPFLIFLPFSSWSVLFVGILVQVTPVTIFFNAAWIFSERITQAEEESIRKGTAKLIKVERRLAWIAWVCYTALALFLVIQAGVR